MYHLPDDIPKVPLPSVQPSTVVVYVVFPFEKLAGEIFASLFANIGLPVQKLLVGVSVVWSIDS
jgi:hypothetical protein